MRILVATDAWHPQVNGVVRTLDVELRRRRPTLGAEIDVPYPGRISDHRPAELSGHPARAAAPAEIFGRIARHRVRTPSISRPKARSAMPCAGIASRERLPFTTSFHTRFADYASARWRRSRRA